MENKDPIGTIYCGEFLGRHFCISNDPETNRRINSKEYKEQMGLIIKELEDMGKQRGA